MEADGIIAAVGTINLDFRSLYLHYECASLIFANDVLKDITADFESTFADSHRITLPITKKASALPLRRTRAPRLCSAGLIHNLRDPDEMCKIAF